MTFLRTALLLLLLPVLIATGAFAAAPLIKGKLSPAAAPPPGAQQVRIGFYPLSVFQLEMGSNTYYVDAYVWLRWKGAIDPTQNLEFTNMVQEWDKQQEVVAMDSNVLPDGTHYKFLRVEGRFVHPFSFADYPFDRQALTITAENTVYGESQLAFVIDKENSGVSESLAIPGWHLDSWSGQSFSHDYGTRFGLDDEASTYSMAQFSITISRPLSFFIWKLLMPLMIVLLAGVSGLLLSPHHIDARTALPIGALLTGIFLQKSYADTLPDLGYLILMDKIYLLAYAIIVLTLIRVIVVYPRYESIDVKGAAEIVRMDRLILAAMSACFALAVAAIVLLR